MDNALIEFGAKLRQELEEIRSLLGDIISRTQESDHQAKIRHADWSDRHRLHVLIDAAEATLSNLPSAIVEPQFLAELAATVEKIRNASTKPNWEEIKPSLVSPTHFNHTLTKLQIAEHFERRGHAVELVPRGEEASPDLKLRAIGGKEEWLFVECYQPKTLNGKRKNLSEAEIKQVTKHSMDKAKEQIGEKSLGLLAISCYNQPKGNLKILRKAIEDRLRKTSRTNLAGIIITSFTTLVRREQGKISFIPIYNIDIVLNPSYFGNIGIDINTNVSDARRIKEPTIEVDGADLIAGKLAQISNTQNSVDDELNTEFKPKKINLKIIEKPQQNGRVIFLRIESRTLPFFTGDGNMNFHCGQCDDVIAKSIWKHSLSNIVILCPQCKTFNEFPPWEELKHKVTKVAIYIGNYKTDGIMKMPRGACLIGVNERYRD